VARNNIDTVKEREVMLPDWFVWWLAILLGVALLAISNLQERVNYLERRKS
jgi:hypothetical protein